MDERTLVTTAACGCSPGPSGLSPCLRLTGPGLASPIIGRQIWHSRCSLCTSALVFPLTPRRLSGIGSDYATAFATPRSGARTHPTTTTARSILPGKVNARYPHLDPFLPQQPDFDHLREEIGRASCRER